MRPEFEYAHNALKSKSATLLGMFRTVELTTKTQHRRQTSARLDESMSISAIDDLSNNVSDSRVEKKVKCSDTAGFKSSEMLNATAPVSSVRSGFTVTTIPLLNANAPANSVRSGFTVTTIPSAPVNNFSAGNLASNTRFWSVSQGNNFNPCRQPSAHAGNFLACLQEMHCGRMHQPGPLYLYHNKCIYLHPVCQVCHSLMLYYSTRVYKSHVTRDFME